MLYKEGDKIEFLEGSYLNGRMGTVSSRFAHKSTNKIHYYVSVPSYGTIVFTEFYLSGWTKLVSKLYFYGI